MTGKIESVITTITSRLKQWDWIDTITVAELISDKVDNPYSFLSFDVYFTGTPAEWKKRREFFTDAGALETSSATTKDRFIFENIPVRIEYKDLNKIDSLLQEYVQKLDSFRGIGTYVFYRIVHGKVLESRSTRYESIKTQIDNFPEDFWKRLMHLYRASIEHCLVDLQSAVLENDSFFYLKALAGFLQGVVSFLYAVNNEFEPSGRFMETEIFKLPVIPENFKGRFLCLINEAAEFPPVRKMEVAGLLTKSLLRMM